MATKHTIVDNVERVAAGIKFMGETRVLVGVPAEGGLGSDRRQDDSERGTNQRKSDDGKTKAPINNATIAYIQDNGAPEANIPAREFLRPGVASIRDETRKRFRDAGRLALDGRPDAAEKQYNAIGLRNQAAVRAKITDGPFQPLAESTLEDRARRGFKGTKPLIVTGQLRNAINYVLRKRT